MKYKDDWEKAQQRLEAWWNGEILDRVALGVTAPRDKVTDCIQPVSEPPDDKTRWLDADFRIREAEHGFAKTYFGGEDFPYFDPKLGPGSLALYLGSEPEFYPDTVWYSPAIADPATAQPLKFDPGNRWWQANIQITSEGVRRGKGKFLVAMPDLIENLDTLASLRGTSELIYDLVDRPDFVHRFQKDILRLWFVYFEELRSMIADDRGGNCFSAFRIWAPGRMAKVQCDFAAMISPEMFAEFVVPYLSRQCSRLDYSVFHLDGLDNVRHLDLLLGIPDLTAIQWTPGAGQPGVGSPTWFPLYRRVREAGKPLLLIGVAADEIEAVIKELGPEGLLIHSSAHTEAEAKEVLKKAEVWSCQ